MVCLALWISLLVTAPGVFAFAPATVVSMPRDGTESTRRPATSLAMSSQSESASLTLYGHPGTRSPLINWACFELQVDLTMGDLSANPHPFGQLPCLTDRNDVLVFESGAILQYIHEQYSDKVTLSRAERAAILSWIMWANASLDPICFLENNGRVYDTGLRQANRRMERLNTLLAQQQWLVSDDKFTLADVAVASYLAYVLQFFPDVTLADKWPAVAKYLQTAVQRPSYGQAFGAATQARLLSGLEKDISAGGTKSTKLFGMF